MLAIVIGNKDEEEVLLVVVLAKDNLERMRLGDPAELPYSTIALPQEIPAQKVRLLVCYEDDIDKVLELQKNPDSARAVLKFLCRGWTTQHDDGMAPMKPGAIQ